LEADGPRPGKRGYGARFLKQTSSLPGSAFVKMNTISMTVTMRKATLKPRLELRQVNDWPVLNAWVGRILGA
jgi:hypothetical protein